jgi:hypothetical protein
MRDRAVTGTFHAALQIGGRKLTNVVVIAQ